MSKQKIILAKIGLQSAPQPRLQGLSDGFPRSRRRRSPVHLSANEALSIVIVFVGMLATIAVLATLLLRKG